MIQYGFVTMFVVGFPLAPLCALINNVIEIQIDSHKVLVSRRRPYTVRAHGIGKYPGQNYSMELMFAKFATAKNR